MGIKLLPATAPLMSQVAKLASLLLLFLLAPLLPPFLRVPYFYLLFNVIVVALGVQAGLLRGGGGGGATSSASDDDVQVQRHGWSSSSDAAGSPPFQRTGPVKSKQERADGHGTSGLGANDDGPVLHHPKKIIIIKKKLVTVLLKKCPSTASIFFLCALDGGRAGDEDEEQVVDEEEREACCKEVVDKDAVMSRQELFARTEMFLGNFRRHLSMKE